MTVVIRRSGDTLVVEVEVVTGVQLYAFTTVLDPLLMATWFADWPVVQTATQVG